MTDSVDFNTLTWTAAVVKSLFKSIMFSFLTKIHFSSFSTCLFFRASSNEIDLNSFVIALSDFSPSSEMSSISYDSLAYSKSISAKKRDGTVS